MKPRILLAVTDSMSLRLMRGLPERLIHDGWQVHIASSPGAGLEELGRHPGIQIHPLPMKRNPSPVRDAIALGRWIALLRRVRPHVSSVGTPKAGLLGGIAALATRVPSRTYVLRGLRYETTRGLTRIALRMLERISCACAHEVIAVSESLRERAILDGIAPPSGVVVIGAGSSNGIDVQWYSFREDRATAARQISSSACDSGLPVIGFIGRIHPDKGLDVLAEACAILARRGTNARLLVVGEIDSPSGFRIREAIESSGLAAEFAGAVPDVRVYLDQMDVLCLPTRREGFPNVVLEAASASIPTVATHATGVADAIVDGETGLVCKTHSPHELAAAIERLLVDDDLRARLGSAARRRAEEQFDRKIVHELIANHYASRLGVAFQAISKGGHIAAGLG